MPRIFIGFCKIEPISMRGFVFNNMIKKKCLVCGNKFITYPYLIKKGEGKYCSNKCYWKSLVGRKHSEETKKKMRKANIGKKRWGWKGNNITYRTLHRWITKHKGNPEICEHCGTIRDKKRFHWANIDHRYRRNLDDYISQRT